ncbi:MAG TPA: hypothetical protein VLD67_20650 [Vicinamibacterales bacterium]|nr:hypothetical protein [Vicinamibacterales bacterium]
MAFVQWMRVLDVIGGLVELSARRRRPQKEEDAAPLTVGGAGGFGQLEAGLAGVVVAALKEAFDRDSARLELERSQIEAERRRAEAAMRTELRRQAADRVVGQLRLVAVTAVGTWALSAILGAWLPGMREGLPRLLLAAGWICAIASLGSAFVAWQALSAWSGDSAEETSIFTHRAATLAPSLLVGALALTAASLLAAL